MSLKLYIYLGLMFILINWSAFHIMNCSQIVYPLIYMVFYCLAMLLIYKADDTRGYFRKLKDALPYEKSYTLMIVSWLMLVAFLSVFLFYRLSYNHETQNLAKYSQLEIAKKINTLTDRKSPDYYPYFILHDTAHVGIENIYTEPFRTTVNDTGDSLQVVFSSDTTSCTSDEEFFVNLIQKTRIIYNTISLHEDQLINVSDRDTLNYHWIKANDTTLVFKTIDYNKSNQGRGDALFMKTYLPVFNAPSFFRFEGFNFWLLFFIMVACFYYMIKYFITRLFLINYFSARDSLPSEKFLPGYDAASHSFAGNTRIILAGLIQSGKKQYVMNLIYGADKSTQSDDTVNSKKNTPQRHVEVDLRNISDATLWGEEKNKIKKAEDPENTGTFNILLITYFEYNLSDAAATLKKLEFIEEQNKKDKCIIILTSIHPIIFLASEKKEIAGAAPSKTISEIDYYKWISLFSEFHMVHFPLSRRGVSEPIGILEAEADALENKTTAAYSLEEMEKKESIIEFIREECDHGRFLYSIGKDLVQYVRAGVQIPGREEIILKVQQLAHSYYLSIWNSFTRNEQYMLYDLAEDGFANYKNRDALSLLFNNGIIINHDRPQLMNQSFKNFILSEVKPGNVVLNDEERAEGSSWKEFKMPFMLVIITVLFFVFYTQEDTFNQILAFVASFTAAIPIILRIFTILPSSKGDKGG